MKYSYNWLKELSKTKKTPEQLAQLISMRAFEFEDSKKEGTETQLEFAILPNRGHDALSHIGMAREICAIEGRKLSPELDYSQRLKLSFSQKLNIKVNERHLCPRYIGTALENIKVGASPKWMQQRLLASGVKPINNIVDITNYVMLETGQPLHAFDLERTAGNIIVRKAKKNEEIKLLDEKVYKLTANDLVIADSEKALALAGVMGGIGSAINNKTASIILESANFDAPSIRKTRMRHNINTESSHRFEREIDPNLAEIGVVRAIELIKKLGGKNVEVIALTDVYAKIIRPWKINLNTNYVNNLLGENIPVSKMKSILENLGLIVKVSGKFLNCETPTRRIDLKTQEDLIEEIGRIYGYENIKEQALCVELKTPPRNEKRIFENKLKNILTGLGFSEVMNYSFYGKDEVASFNLDESDHIEVSNPLSLDQQYLRTTLIPGIVRNATLNLKYFNDFSIFEIGDIFSAKKGEKTKLAGALMNRNQKNNPYYDLKGKLEELFRCLNLPDVEFAQPKVAGNFVHPTRTAVIKLKNTVVGYIAELNPNILRKYDLKDRLVCFELDVVEVMKTSDAFEKSYHPISKFPTVNRDISMFVDENTKYADITKEIKKTGGELIKNITLFDKYKDSLAIRIEIGSNGKTLTSSEIDTVVNKIIHALEKKLGVKVRK